MPWFTIIIICTIMTHVSLIYLNWHHRFDYGAIAWTSEAWKCRVNLCHRTSVRDDLPDYYMLLQIFASRFCQHSRSNICNILPSRLLVYPSLLQQSVNYIDQNRMNDRMKLIFVSLIRTNRTPTSRKTL